MKNLRLTRTKTVLLQWIMTCIIILLIPFVTIIVNYCISRKIINEQVKNSSNIILSHMQKAIDGKLQSIRNLSYLLLLDDNFINLSNAWGSDEFFDLAQTCYDKLNSYNYVYNDINILVYYPYKDYVITTGVSNTSASIYNSMYYASQKNMTSYDNWISLIGNDYSKASYFFSEYCSYKNTGKNSVVFGCTNPFIYRDEANYNLLVSSPVDFIEDDLADLPERTFFICDRNGNPISQFGTRIESSEPLPVMDPETSNVTLNGENYFCYYAPSPVTGWFYVLCTPRTLYLHDSLLMRNVTLASAIISLLIGVAMVIYTQYRNYRPVKRIMNIIPTSIKSDEKNEFQQIELYHGEMHRLNLFMQNKLNNISKNVRELYFYSKLKGVNFHIQENDITNTMSLDFSDKHFVIASIYADSHSFSQDDIMKNWELLQFAVNNVSDEILQDHFPHEHIQDEFFHVFFFILDKNQFEEWNRSGPGLLEDIFKFFKSQFHIDLFITVSQAFENFEQTASVYADVITAFEEYYAKKQPGVYTTSPSKKAPVFSDTKFSEYSRDINLAVFQHDYDKAAASVHSYIGYLQQYNCSKIIVRYNVYSLIATILMDSGDYISQTTRDTIESYLSNSLNCNTLEEYESHINQLLHYLCDQNLNITDNIQDRENQLVKKIKNYVENYYSDYSLNVTSVAEAVNLSPNYMSKIFKNNTKEGLLSYINNVRINHAKELLRTTNINVDEIALMVGFSNTRSFRRNFQNLTGITATDYRNGVR
ncbi:helix-turn-helix domain-containing protein [Clostridium sp. MCC353]|uniref:AraC family transcriptional regulator n=1 Tax=Clostridium sp. MCC353 TaxID=2592646 RepID=UPI001C0394EC|nr:AraC family transcriptional regulator [Clostridium sp. MCC353]MBT9776182.1 helix-turn-helix domain-containing protein [Clostridium sp. MCC353]